MRGNENISHVPVLTGLILWAWHMQPIDSMQSLSKFQREDNPETHMRMSLIWECHWWGDPSVHYLLQCLGVLLRISRQAGIHGSNARNNFGTSRYSKVRLGIITHEHGDKEALTRKQDIPKWKCVLIKWKKKARDHQMWIQVPRVTARNSLSVNHRHPAGDCQITSQNVTKTFIPSSLFWQEVCEMASEMPLVEL